MVSVEVLSVYWSSPWTVGVVVSCLASMATLAYVFSSNSRNAKLRISILSGLYALSIFFWTFVAISLLVCEVMAEELEYSNVLGLAIIISVVLSLLIATFASYAVWRVGPNRIMRRLHPREPASGETWLQEFVYSLSDAEDVSSTTVRITEIEAPLCLAVGGKENCIVTSKMLLELLDQDEMKAVLAHELMHIKNHDSKFKVLSSVMSKVMFFDPFSKFFDPAVHREREYLADEAGARACGRPASLASALLKMNEQGGIVAPFWGLNIFGRAGGIFGRYPPLRERIRRLLHLSDLMVRRAAM